MIELPRMNGKSNRNFVVKELLRYYRNYSIDPIYQRKVLEIWQIEADSNGEYSGAYREAVLTIIAEKPH
jgi:hypothetical protein